MPTRPEGSSLLLGPRGDSAKEVTPAEAREIYTRLGGFAAEAADFLLGFNDYDGNPADPADAIDFDPRCPPRRL